MAVTKKVVSFFGRKNRVTPSVVAPGYTNPSDATVEVCTLNASDFTIFRLGYTSIFHETV